MDSTTDDNLCATAVAPATVGNVAVGFDILGFSTGVDGDRVTVRRIDEPTVRIDSIDGVVTELPTDPEQNTATAGLLAMRRELDIDGGFAVSIDKALPLGSGMGGSACSAAASVVAATSLIDQQLTPLEQLRYALVGESAATDSVHADNVAPALYGGLVLVPSTDPREVIELPVPTDLHTVVVRPDIRIDTRRARQVLPDRCSIADHCAQSAHLAALIAGCYRDEVELVACHLRDIIVEPHRAPLIPGFHRVQQAALDAGAFGASISGAGPALFAWGTEEQALDIRNQMVAAFDDAGVEATGYTGPIDRRGTYLRCE